MPGFMQSIKSHLPPSPFSPNKKGAPAVATPEVITAATDAPALEEQSTSSEVLPGEALVQPNSSTVALTLTPANGESSQQLTPDDAEATPELIHQLGPPAEVESTAVASATEIPSQTVQTDAVQSIAEEVSADATLDPEAPTVAAESTPTPEPDATASPEPTSAGQAQPQVEASETNSDGPVPQDEVAPLIDEATASGEVPNDVTTATPEADSSKPLLKTGKEGFSCHMKRNKSKKTKSDSPETLEVTGPAPCKPRKSNPLAGKFRNVIDQVRSKIKKDKESLVEKVEPMAPPAVEVIEPAPVCEEVAASA